MYMKSVSYIMIDVIRYACGYNSVINVMGVSKCFLVGYMATLWKECISCNLIIWSKTHGREAHRPYYFAEWTYYQTAL